MAEDSNSAGDLFPPRPGVVQVLPPGAQTMSWLDEAHGSSYGPPARLVNINRISAKDRADLVEQLMPDILARLRALAPPTALAMAHEAASTRPLDRASLNALVDWLRDERFDGLADEVARLPVEGGNLVVLRGSPFSGVEDFRSMRKALMEKCPGVNFLILPHGWNAAAFQWALPELGGSRPSA